MSHMCFRLALKTGEQDLLCRIRFSYQERSEEKWVRCIYSELSYEVGYMMQVPLKLLALGSITHTYETCDDERLRSTGRSVCSIVWVQVPILSAAQQESAWTLLSGIPLTGRHCWEKCLRDMVWRV